MSETEDDLITFLVPPTPIRVRGMELGGYSGKWYPVVAIGVSGFTEATELDGVVRYILTNGVCWDSSDVREPGHDSNLRGLLAKYPDWKFDPTWCEIQFFIDGEWVDT